MDRDAKERRLLLRLRGGIDDRRKLGLRLLGNALDMGLSDQAGAGDSDAHGSGHGIPSVVRFALRGTGAPLAFEKIATFQCRVLAPVDIRSLLGTNCGGSSCLNPNKSTF